MSVVEVVVVVVTLLVSSSVYWLVGRNSTWFQRVQSFIKDVGFSEKCSFEVDIRFPDILMTKISSLEITSFIAPITTTSNSCPSVFLSFLSCWYHCYFDDQELLQRSGVLPSHAIIDSVTLLAKWTRFAYQCWMSDSSSFSSKPQTSALISRWCHTMVSMEPNNSSEEADLFWRQDVGPDNTSVLRCSSGAKSEGQG